MASARTPFRVPLPGGRTLDLGERCLVMGILNVTPDSFGDRRPLRDPAAAVDAGVGLEAEGADLVDVGGESTRPGAEPVSTDEELERVIPVIRGLAARVRVPISVDTYKAPVAAAALDAGASIVNDISGLQYDPPLARAVAARGAALVLMHMRGRPQAMYAHADYGDLIDDLVHELRASLERAIQAGVGVEGLIVDPGVGFAKRPAHSYGVLARLPEIAAALSRPVLVGPSRKSFLREAAGERAAPERDWATAAAVTSAVLGGAHIVRVHAVAEMVQVVRAAEELRRASPSLLP